MIGVVIIAGICILPLIKLALLTGVYKLAGAITQPIADERIVNLLDQMGDVFKLLLGVMFSVSTLLIVGITLAIRISNSSMMYR